MRKNPPNESGVNRHETQSLDQYIDAQLNIYEIEVPGLARVFLAANKQSVRDASDANTRPLIDADNSGTDDPKKLKPKLYRHPSYGGTRLEAFDPAGLEQSRRNGIKKIMELAFKESHVKHMYLNRTMKDGALEGYLDNEGKTIREAKAWHPEQTDIPADFDLGQGFFELAFRGGRCVIVPENEEAQKRMEDSNSSEAETAYKTIFKKVGNFLNGRESATLIAPDGTARTQHAVMPEGSLFLTPDFGANKHLADWLHETTPYVLGVKREVGGGGGKASYTVSGVMGALEACAENGRFDPANLDTPITLIGAAGAMGEDLAERLAKAGYRNVRIADLQYGDLTHVPETLPGTWRIVPSMQGKFTDEALRNSGQENGLIITTATANELEHSNIDAIPRGTTLLLAQNLSLPEKPSEAVALARKLQERDIMVIPGQALTPGGAGNSKLEIYWRAKNGLTKDLEKQNLPSEQLFPKRLGHENVQLMVKTGVGNILKHVQRQNITSVEAMSHYTDLPAFASNEVHASNVVVGAQGVPLEQEPLRRIV